MRVIISHICEKDCSDIADGRTRPIIGYCWNAVRRRRREILCDVMVTIVFHAV